MILVIISLCSKKSEGQSRKLAVVLGLDSHAYSPNLLSNFLKSQYEYSFHVLTMIYKAV